MKSLFDLPQEEFEKEIDKILDSPSGAKCLLCGYALTNADEINYDESVECCEEHGFIVLGPLIGGFLLSYLDPHKARHVSGFWKFVGLHVEDGFAVKRQKKKKLGFNPKLRAFMWRIADSLLKQNTPVYRQIYDERKVKEEAKLNYPNENPEKCPFHGDCVKKLKEKAKRIGRKMKKPPCKKHIHRRAARYMVKAFLRDLWVEWREMEGLPVSEPYDEEAPHG